MTLARAIEKMGAEERSQLEGRIGGMWWALERLKARQLQQVVEIRMKGRQVKRLAIVQLRRMGDIVSIAPLGQRYHDLGWTVDWYGEPESTTILQHAPWLARRVPWDKLTTPGGYDKVIIPQVDQNPVAVEKGRNYQHQQWIRSGHPDGLGVWPLALTSPRLSTGRCDVLWNGAGVSSPFGDATRFRAWLGANYNVTDWPSLLDPTEALDWLVGAKTLVSVDSMPIHLARLTQTPTIVLTRGGWDQSEPMPHWLGAVRYGDWEGSLGKIRAWLDRTDDRPVHVTDYWLPKPGDEYDRIVAARSTACSAWRTVPWSGIGRRSSRDVGDPKGVPYIKDIIDFGVSQTKGWVVFTNADVRLCADVTLDGAEGCAFSRRKDMHAEDANRKHWRSDDSEFKRIPDHVGADLFAVTADWWRSHRDEVPDLLMTYEGWDYCMRHVMGLDRQLTTCCYHVKHASYWMQHEVLNDGPGQVYNRSVARPWAKARNLPVRESDYLFDPDPT